MDGEQHDKEKNVVWTIELQDDESEEDANFDKEQFQSSLEYMLPSKKPPALRVL